MPPRADALVPPFGPLAGVRVVDTGRFVAGPWAATHLGEFGAEVIHVEGPPFERPYADPTRGLPPLLPVDAPPEASTSESWVQYGRNKLSLGLDVRTKPGRTLFLKLLARSDIWIEASRPGTFERFGLGDGIVLRTNPRLTVVHVSGYGQTGDPERIGRPSYDLIAQAYSGYLALQGEASPAPPQRAGTALNDTVTGLAAAGAALMGYVCASRTGRGQVVDVAQYEVFFTLLENLALDYFARGVVRGRHGTGHPRLHPYDLYPAKDGWIVVAAPTVDAWLRLRELIGLPPGPWDEMSWRTSHRAEIDARIRPYFAVRTLAELEEAGRASDLAFARASTIDELAADPHYAARGMFLSWEDPVAGRVRGAGIAPKFRSSPGRVWRGAPWLGQDNDAILGRLLGVRSARRRRLEAAKVIGADPPASSPPTRAPARRPRKGGP
ncbi:MAG: CoA transferase [Thermoplasmata archaeon]|nr:CoA transferase [Thermoplasmata archaeon]